MITIEPNSTLYGKVIGVDNKELLAKLRQLNGELLTFRITEEQARLLGKRLLDNVMLYGDKSIDLSTLSVVDFKMTGIDEDFAKDASIPVNEWGAYIREAGDFSRLDEIGADAYLKEIRDEL